MPGFRLLVVRLQPAIIVLGMSLMSSVIGSPLRIGIVHARWNDTLISALLSGAKKTLKAAGVKDENIVVQSVPGSWELPAAVRGYVLLLRFLLDFASAMRDLNDDGLRL
jgi:hypothetical protein